MAVSVLYGPPTPRMIQTYNDAVGELEREEEERSRERSRQRAQSTEMIASSASLSEEPAEEVDGEEDGGDVEGTTAWTHETEESDTQTNEPTDPSTPERLFSENPTTFLANQKKSPLRKTIRKWIKQKSKTIREQYWEKDKRKDLVDPSEGIMHLEKPLLLCQEIYTRIIGNHQTSLVSKERVLELLQQDNAQHAAEHPEQADDTYSPIMTTDDSADEDMRVEVMDATAASFYVKNCPPVVDAATEIPENGYYLDIERSVAMFDLKKQQNETNEEKMPSSPGRGISERKESELQDDTENEEIIHVPEEDQPLVGYWLWENTFRTHKVKMYVAKGTDLALHVVLAILTNQVRYERNAIAMTI